MIYLICQDWANTSNNHAGIKYMCEKMHECAPHIFEVRTIPSFTSARTRSKIRFIAALQVKFAQFKHKIFLQSLLGQMQTVLKDGDVVFLTEYMEMFFPMKNFAEQMRKKFPNIPIWAMVHLVPSKLNASFPSDSEFLSWTKCVNRIYTLGSSLTKYLIKRGFPFDKIVTTFHYVDDYYNNSTIRYPENRVKVIVMGNQVRNIKLLKAIIEANPNIDFTLCQGSMDLTKVFRRASNVLLIPFVPESQLRQYMFEADISLNVMDDTVGSNVIVTSLAMGLALICSDVGSIRDYCDDENTIFCENTVHSFSNAIQALSTNRQLLFDMKQSANKRAKALTIGNFIKTIG